MSMVVALAMALAGIAFKTPSALAQGPPPPARMPPAEEAGAFRYLTNTIQETPTPPSDGRQRSSLTGAIFGLVLAFIASVMALGFAFGLRRRIDQIAGPPPDEDD